ncbi:hypothetical protein BO78DRAFT_468569 [Aspergillus sclerotiicarbonarius CBS 121057]|uniref:MARVEL domain-containing protein n=1 Tax=Aspergillus sclerotiicarbonarius (strain CBS 121057 / IBT 28362) TaxID=1448318 RepID=A0A319FK35_ASPSB|nr:hypothetical protein BO78DRAFT_468569 [Aspergillus sclerotiicarbonarius CBS 121057]
MANHPPTDQTKPKPKHPRSIASTTLRTTQLLLSIIIAVLYGVDLAHASKSNTHAQASWIYAEFVTTVSAITSAAHLILPASHAGWSTLDGVILVLWVAQVGVFGTMYLPVHVAAEDVHFSSSVSRMQAAVWLDMICLGLWVGTTGLGIVRCVRGERRTGRSGDKEGQRVEGDEEQRIDSEKTIDVEGAKRLSLASTIWDRSEKCDAEFKKGCDKEQGN